MRTLVGVVPVEFCTLSTSSAEIVLMRGFSRWKTQSVLVASGSIVEVHWNIKLLEFPYKWGLTLEVLAFTLMDSERILLTNPFQSAITYNRSPIITPTFYCKYKNPCLTWIQFKREKPNVSITSWHVLTSWIPDPKAFSFQLLTVTSAHAH